MDTLTSDLFSLTKRFIAQSAFEEKDIEFEEDMAMAKFYRHYGMEERFWQTIRVLRKSQQDSPYRDALYFHKQFLLEEEAGSFESMNNRFEDDVNLAVAIQNLDIAYAINKVEFICVLSYQQKLSQQVHFDISNPLTQAALHLPEEFPHVAQYELNRLVFRLIRDPNDDEEFSLFETMLEKHKSELPFEKVRNLKAYYRFFWNRRYVNSGGAQARQQMFEVYREALRARILL